MFFPELHRELTWFESNICMVLSRKILKSLNKFKIFLFSVIITRFKMPTSFFTVHCILRLLWIGVSIGCY